MDRILELNINDIELKGMLEQCPSIIDMDNNYIENMLNILRYVGCNDKHIKNIIISNPYYLERIDRDVLKLIKYLKEIGLSSLGLIFDMNPFLLNKDVFEIKEYVNKRINDGILLDDIIDEIESNPYVLEEV